MEMVELGNIRRDFRPRGSHQSIHDLGKSVFGEHGRTLQTLSNNVDGGGLGMVLFLSQDSIDSFNTLCDRCLHPKCLEFLEELAEAWCRKWIKDGSNGAMDSL